MHVNENLAIIANTLQLDVIHDLNDNMAALRQILKKGFVTVFA